MPRLAHHQVQVTDSAGNIVARASVEVRHEGNGALATLYSDQAGASPLSNPFLADANGIGSFYCAGGYYKITAASGKINQVLRNIAIGTAQANDGPISVFDYGAVGDGNTDDTAAFNAAIAAAGVGGWVVAPGGFTYSLNGVLISLDRLRLRIDGNVVVPPGAGSAVNTGIIIDKTGVYGGVTQAEIDINGTLNGKEGLPQPNASGHFCVGVSLRSGVECRVHIKAANYLTTAVEVRPDLSSDLTNAASASHLIDLDICFSCFHCVRGCGGTVLTNHTQGCIVRTRFFAGYGYAVRKQNVGGNLGDQGYWDVAGAFDALGNVNFVKTIQDDFANSYYRLTFSDGIADIAVGSGTVVHDMVSQLLQLNGVTCRISSSGTFVAPNAEWFGFRLHNDTGDYDAVLSDVNNNTFLRASASALIWGQSGANFSVGVFEPLSDNAYTLGANGSRWSAVWAANGTIQTSDPSLKTDIKPLPEGALEIVREVTPKTFKWKTGGLEPDFSEVGGHEVEVEEPAPTRADPKATRQRKVRTKVDLSKLKHKKIAGKRTHWGFMANEVKAAVDKTKLDFGGYVKAEDGVEHLRPDQLIPILWKAVQELTDQVETLKKTRTGRRASS